MSSAEARRSAWSSSAPGSADPPGDAPAGAAALSEGAPTAGNRELAEQIAGLRDELAAREQQLTEVEAAAHARIATLSEALSAIQESTTWRATAPVRAVAAALPEPVRIALRRLARNAYWVLTPHRIPFRRRWFTYYPLDLQTSNRLASLSAEVRERRMPLRRSMEQARSSGSISTVPRTPVRQCLCSFMAAPGRRKRPSFPRSRPRCSSTPGRIFIVPEFIGIQEADGDLRVVAQQVWRAIAWVFQHAENFGGDPDRLFVGGHSSGGHLCGVAMVTNWQKDFGLPADMVKGGLLMSGVYDLASVRQSKLSPHIRFTDEIEQAMSPRRHLDLLRAPVVITCGTCDSPEFRSQSRDFYAAAAAAGKAAELFEAANSGHMDVAESLGNP
jgi:hypothetical protein